MYAWPATRFQSVDTAAAPTTTLIMNAQHQAAMRRPPATILYSTATCVGPPVTTAYLTTTAPLQGMKHTKGQPKHPATKRTNHGRMSSTLQQQHVGRPPACILQYNTRKSPIAFQIMQAAILDTDAMKKRLFYPLGLVALYNFGRDIRAGEKLRYNENTPKTPKRLIRP